MLHRRPPPSQPQQPALRQALNSPCGNHRPRSYCLESGPPPAAGLHTVLNAHATAAIPSTPAERSRLADHATDVL